MSELHHRCHEEVHKYWDRLRGERNFPNENEIDPDALGEFWTSCFLVSIDSVSERIGYRYSYLGSDLIKAYGDDGTDADVAMHLLTAHEVPLIQQLDLVRDHKVPVTDESEFTNSRKMKVKYRACMLPLGHGGDDVTYILGCMRWKMY